LKRLANLLVLLFRGSSENNLCSSMLPNKAFKRTAFGSRLT
jgi:hypothetical protein